MNEQEEAVLPAGRRLNPVPSIRVVHAGVSATEKGASDKLQEEQDTSSVSVVLRSRGSCLTAGIAVLLSLISEMTCMSTIVDVLKRDLSKTVDALKRDIDDMSHASAAVASWCMLSLKRHQDDALRLSMAADASQRHMRQLSTTVDALKRDQDDMRQLSTTRLLTP
ncbi:hypothetical protein Bbelb_014170 [Branchiostoma belcheri]|nr:hypothetical protein Bbelb_014170 [Branchiostoma belcheri]